MLYDLHAIWYDNHNKEHSKYHILTKEDVTDWDTSKPCKTHNCPADIFNYLTEPKLWIDGDAISGSIETTKRWVKQNYELAVITRVSHPIATKPSWDWLRICFPHIPDIMMVTGDIKSWVMGDILIDDAIHNHQDFQGISILLDQPWNRANKTLIRAKDWNHIEAIVARAERYVDHYRDLADDNAHELWAHKWIEARLKIDIDEGLL